MKKTVSIIMLLSLIIISATGCASVPVDFSEPTPSADIQEAPVVDNAISEEGLQTDETIISEASETGEIPLDVYRLEDGSKMYTKYDEYTSENATEPIASVMFVSKDMLTKFKFLDITFEDIDENGNVQYSVIEQSTFAVLAPDRPLVVNMTMVGTIPNNGISFVDIHGNTRYFAISESGEDGSVFLQEFFNPTFG